MPSASAARFDGFCGKGPEVKLGNTFRAIAEIIAVLAASWALLVSPLMLFGAHGVSSDHDKSLGKICLLGSIVIFAGIWRIEKKYPWAKNQ